MLHRIYNALSSAYSHKEVKAYLSFYEIRLSIRPP